MSRCVPETPANVDWHYDLICLTWSTYIFFFARTLQVTQMLKKIWVVLSIRSGKQPWIIQLQSCLSHALASPIFTSASLIIEARELITNYPKLPPLA